MRRIRAATILSSFCAAVDGGRAAIAAPFSAANPKPKPHTKPPSHIFGVFVRNQLQNEESASKILFREYCGRATKDEECHEFLKNLWNECQTDYEKYEIVSREFHEVFKDMTKDDYTDDELDATQNDRVDKLAEIAAEEELDGLITNSFVTNLMIECEPKYEKRFRAIIVKIRNKMIQDDGILEAFELVTNLMSKCDPEYEKLLCEVLEKVREKFCQDDKGGNGNTSKIEKLAKLDMEVCDIYNFQEELDKFVTGLFLKNLRLVEKMKSHFMAYEVIEKVAKKVGNENLCKIAEEQLDALVTNYFVSEIVGVQTKMPYVKLLRIVKSLSRRERIVQTRRPRMH